MTQPINIKLTKMRPIKIGDIVRLTENRISLKPIGIAHLAGSVAIVTAPNYPRTLSGEPRVGVWVGRDRSGLEYRSTCFAMRWQVYPIHPKECSLCPGDRLGWHAKMEPYEVNSGLTVSMCRLCDAIARKIGPAQWRFFL